jgi:transposase-like protein
MEDYPKTIIEFDERFATEDACRQYLFQLRWPEGFRCPHCDYGKAWTKNNELYQCKKCGYRVSVIAGTIFQDTKKPLRLWFKAIWYITSQNYGVSALGLKKVLGLGSYRTAWTWLHKLRFAMVRPGRDRLSGIVEIDETYIGGEKSGKRGRGAAGKAIVLVAAEDKGNHIGRIRLHRIIDASAESLTKAVIATVEPGAIIRTDGWNGYNLLPEAGFTRIVVRKESIIGDNLLPIVNRVVSLLKRWLLGTHQGAVQPSYLDYYLDEFTFRFNRRTSRSRGKLFYRLVHQAVAIHPFTGKELKKG